MQSPQELNLVIRNLANAVDKLSGEVAALTAYVAATTKVLPDADTQLVQGAAQRACPQRLGLGGGGSPQQHASQTVTRIQYIARDVQPKVIDIASELDKEEPGERKD